MAATYVTLRSVAQIREQMLVPDLYVFTLKFEIPQQPMKIEKKKLQPKTASRAENSYYRYVPRLI